MTRAEMREWLRIRLGIVTPYQRWEEAQSLSTDPTITDEETPPPLKGAWPSWSPQPYDSTLNDAIRSACKTVNRQVNVSGVTVKSVAVAAQTADGPYVLGLGSIPGYPERSVINVRRAWWYDGSTNQRLTPRLVGDKDRRGSTYLEDAVGTPGEFWVEGYTLFLDPAPSSAGTLKLVTGDGLLAPDDDQDVFDPLPDSYDDAILYIALVELGTMLPNDTEMQRRAQGFTPFAQQGMADIMTWFHGGNNEETEPTLIFDARMMRRGMRR